jgi:hypothetical protein
LIRYHLLETVVAHYEQVLNVCGVPLNLIERSSMVATCKRQGIDPWAYLADVLTRLLPNRADPSPVRDAADSSKFATYDERQLLQINLIGITPPTGSPNLCPTPGPMPVS